MKYLTKEIEVLSKHLRGRSLVRTGISCGIFQDCNPNKNQPDPNQIRTTKE
jgi:hypothetical protein